MKIQKLHVDFVFFVFQLETFQITLLLFNCLIRATTFGWETTGKKLLLNAKYRENTWHYHGAITIRIPSISDSLNGAALEKIVVNKRIFQILQFRRNFIYWRYDKVKLLSTLAPTYRPFCIALELDRDCPIHFHFAYRNVFVPEVWRLKISLKN